MWRRRSNAPRADDRITHFEREYARLFSELEATQQRYRGLARGVWRVQEDERRNLARELHDELGQLLTALIHRLERTSGDEREGCIDLARQALSRVRKLSRLLRPPVLDDLGLAAALNWLARQTREHTGLDVAVTTPTALPRLEPDMETLMYRIAQEALTNAVKHAGARRVTLGLERAGNELELRIRDDGAGFAPHAVDGFQGSGLGGMRDRVALFGGALAVRSAPGRGTEIIATLTLADAAKADAPEIEP
jgi:signal transduction histidine kinase